MTNPNPDPEKDDAAQAAADTDPACVIVFNASDPSGAGGIAADIAAIVFVGVFVLPVLIFA